MKKHWDLQIFAENGEQGGDGSQNAGGESSTQKGGWTYEQVDEVANARAERASRAALADFFRKQGMSESEVTNAISEYKKSKAENQPDISAIEKQRDKALEEVTKMKNHALLTQKGVRSEDADYVLFKVNQMADENKPFDKALDEFLKNNSRFAGQASYKVNTGTSGSGNAQTDTKNNDINAAIRNAARR